MRFPQIDYEEHPAYSPYRTTLSYDNELISTQIQAADLAYANFCNNRRATERDMADALSRIKSNADQIMLHVRQQNIAVTAEEWLHSSMQWVFADMGYEFARRLFAVREYRPNSLSGAQLEQLSAMRSRGMYVTDLGVDGYRELRRLALLHRESLKSQAVRNPFKRSVLNVGFNTPLWNVIKRVMGDGGVTDVLSALKGNRMTMLGAGLEYSFSEQRWSQDLYADVGISDSPLRYLHFDEGYCLPKAMIYVTPVHEGTGPTRAVPGSNCWESSELVLRVHRALDRVVGDRYDRFGSRGDYRPAARCPDLRRIFMQLPTAFRGSSHFGDDVLPGTEIANRLQELEVAYLSDGGQTLVFDGPHLLHRGSLVRSGERLALQVIFRNRSEARIKAHLSKETYLKEQMALGRKYVRKFVMSYM